MKGAEKIGPYIIKEMQVKIAAGKLAVDAAKEISTELREWGRVWGYKSVFDYWREVEQVKLIKELTKKEKDGPEYMYVSFVMSLLWSRVSEVIDHVVKELYEKIWVLFGEESEKLIDLKLEKCHIRPHEVRLTYKLRKMTRKEIKALGLGN